MSSSTRTAPDRPPAPPLGGVPAVLRPTVDEALGRAHRHQPAVGRTGGPAGNARLASILGLGMLVLFLAQLVTLIDVIGLMSWHVVLGALLIPPALAKTATTTWRVGRYYRGHRAYLQAGPPPLVPRVLGPLVVASTLGVLASGVVLILLGPAASRTVLVSGLGQQVDWVTVHQGLFILFGVFTGLHLVLRLVPALRHTVARAGATAAPGRGHRGVVLLATLGVAIALATVLLARVGQWHHDPYAGAGRHDDGAGRPAVTRLH